jgi:arginase
VKISITNVHLDLGSGRRGTDMGPSAMHVAGLVPQLKALGHEVVDVIDIDSRSFETLSVGDTQARFLSTIAATTGRIADRVESSMDEGCFPLVLGGDHSVAIGTVSGLSRYFKKRGEQLGVVWVDAHTDVNTPATTPSGNVHGMPLAVLLGHGPEELVRIAGDSPALRPEDVVVIGARQVDPGEVDLVAKLGIRVFSMSELDHRGTATCVDEAFEQASRESGVVHLSFDLDAADPSVAPGVGTPVAGGLNLRESHLICETVASLGVLVGLEMVELNPTLDHENQTGRLAVWLILSALGKTIL